jgi:ABC-type glycerol-3-phosphate transport system substrate-binding protein
MAANNGSNFRAATGGGVAVGARTGNGNFETLRVNLEKNNNGIYDVADGVVGIFYTNGAKKAYDFRKGMQKRK